MDNFDRWLESGADSGLDEQDRIDEEQARLLKEENNPDNYANFIEAITEDCLAEHSDLLEDALQKNDKALIGLIISSAVYTYWEEKSLEEAQLSEEGGFLL
ncbi:MAG: hypothetical protein ACR2HS_00985 [Gammaproteobacteria bacterium]